MQYSDDGIAELNRKWFVLRTKPRAERQVEKVLESRQIVTYLPLLRRRKTVEPLFPNYMFLWIDRYSDEYLRSRSAPGVNYILSNEGEPIPIADALVEAIRQRVEHENSLGPAARFKPGDRVVIRSGPFRDVEAIFDRQLSPSGRVAVLLQIVNRTARIQIDADLLVKVRR